MGRSAPSGRHDRLVDSGDDRARRDPRPRRERAALEVETVWDARIPGRDGVELSANMWLPRPEAVAADERFPAILEMIPYGKDNWRRNADVARGE